MKESEKKAYKEAMARYRVWNEEKLLTRAYLSQRMTTKEKWRAFLDLYSFAFKINPRHSSFELERRTEERIEYLARMRRFEERRRARGQKT
jgi:hypothetical protein